MRENERDEHGGDVDAGEHAHEAGVGDLGEREEALREPQRHLGPLERGAEAEGARDGDDDVPAHRAARFGHRNGARHDQHEGGVDGCVEQVEVLGLTRNRP